MKIINLLLSFLSVCTLIKNGDSLNINRSSFINYSAGLLVHPLASKYNLQMSNQESNENINEREYETKNPLSITYYGEISTKNCLFLTNSLKTMDLQSKEHELQYNYRPPIKIHLQSLGGELMPSFYVCDFIKELDTPVHIYIDGFVASAASLISVCGKKRIMTKHSFMLIHQLSSQSSGKFNEMKDEIKNLDFFMDNLKDIYLSNSKMSPEKLDQLLATDIWISAQDCLEMGLIDQII